MTISEYVEDWETMPKECYDNIAVVYEEDDDENRDVVVVSIEE